jgi:hypothetical protein
MNGPAWSMCRRDQGEEGKGHGSSGIGGGVLRKTAQSGQEIFSMSESNLGHQKYALENDFMQLTHSECRGVPPVTFSLREVV